MNINFKIVGVILLCGLCSFIIRAIPFILFGGKKEPPDIIKYLGKVSPSAVMAVLVIYCLKDVLFSSIYIGIPAFVGVGATILTHLYKKNTLLSVFVGTLCYMIIIRL